MNREDDKTIVDRLSARGLIVPVPSPPAGLHEPFRLERGLGFLAAQMSSRDGKCVHLGARWCRAHAARRT